MKDKMGRISLFIVLFITTALAFRLVNFKQSFFFAHDQDLYSWIAKDIVVNHHMRLVGQLTSVDGVFIGSFYYYLMAFFYRISGMNPISAIIPITLLAIFNIWSFYWVVAKHFSKRAGVIAAFIYAFSFGVVRFDRWSVPTLPTLTWSIWFIELILEMIKGNLKWLLLYGFLVGFVWQLHIALIPILPIPIFAFLMGKNKISLLWSKRYGKVTISAILIFLITISPFFAFEFKHNFSQVQSIIASTKKDIGAPTGKMKLLKVVDAMSRETQQRLLFGFNIKAVDWYAVTWIILLVVPVILKKINWTQEVAFLLWVVLICLAQFLSKRVVSEYYFTNLIPIYILLISVFLESLLNTKVLIVVGSIYFAINLLWLFTKTDEDQSYFYREEVVNYIKNDVEKNKYPCVAINFIADPGVGVGFRYLFWYKGVKLVKPGVSNAPIYNVPIPWQLSQSESPIHYGRFGVLLPKPVKGKITEAECNDPKNQLDPLLGYTE